MTASYEFKAPKKLSSGQICKVTTAEGGKVMLPSFQACDVTCEPKGPKAHLLSARVDRGTARRVAALEEDILRRARDTGVFRNLEQQQPGGDEAVLSSVSVDSAGLCLRLRTYGTTPTLPANQDDDKRGCVLTLRMRVVGVMLQRGVASLAWEVIEAAPVATGPKFVEGMDNASSDEDAADVLPCKEELVEEVREALAVRERKLGTQLDALQLELQELQLDIARCGSALSLIELEALYSKYV